MIKSMKLVAILLIVAALSSCNNKSNKDEASKDGIKNEIKDTIDVIKDFASEELDNFEADIQSFKESVDLKLDELRKTSEKLSGETKRQYAVEVNKLEKQHNEFNAKLDAFHKANNDKKDELKSEILNLRNALNKSIKTFEKEKNENTTK